MTNKNSFKIFKNIIYVQLVADILFTLFSLSFHADISLLAFPIALIFTAAIIYAGFFKIARDTNGNFYTLFLKLVQYIPYGFLLSFIIRRAGNFGTPYWYDLITVLLWCVVFVCSIILSYKMNEKRCGAVIAEWSVRPSFKKPKGGKRIIFEALDWIDAIAWALFTVLLVQIFLFQLYTIPSESMVPTFLVKDRVAVSKIDCGPKFPLTDIGLPDLRKYKRGDTIVLRNPHYNIDRKSEVKSVASQLIYMLTIMTVNINRDENGVPKADPLVKRISGLPGEQLVMQDGTLYTRTKDSDDWTPAEMDRKYATWNLNSVKAELKPRIQTFPFTAEEYEVMLQLEESRRNLDLDAAMFNAKEISNKFSKLAYTNNLDQKFTPPSLMIYELLNPVNVQDITRKMMTQEGGVEWFNDFMTSWIPAKLNNRDMYEEANYRLNVMAKIAFGNLVVRYADLMRNSVSATKWNSDTVLIENHNMAQNLIWYVQVLLDSRNMCVFPANDSYGNPQYIPENCYFMMGDNRFNSLDLRHSNGFTVTELTKDDKYSFNYQTMLAPQYINKKYIIGKPVFRFWPVSRMSRIR